MTVFRYTAMDAYGKRRRGHCSASSEQALEQQLRGQGLDLLTSSAQGQAVFSGVPWLAQKPAKLDQKTLTVFCLQLAQLCQAGVPILQALSELAQADAQHATAQVLQQLYDDVEAGKLLSQAMQLQQGAFPPWVAHLVAAAEYSGRLPDILEQVASTLQWQTEMKSQLLQGLLYPMLLALVVLAAATMMLTVLVPQMVSFLQSMGQSLPWTTRTLLALSAFTRKYALWVLLGLGVFGLLLRAWLRASTHRLMQWQRFCSACPVMGKLLHLWVLGSLCRMLALLYQSGVPLMQALSLCQPMMPWAIAQHALQTVEQQLQSGQTLADSFAHNPDCFPPLLVRMVRTGEQTGGLDRCLWQLADWYMREVQTRLQWLLRMLEPLMTLILGMLLLFLMVAVIMPVYDSFNQMGQPYAH